MVKISNGMITAVIATIDEMKMGQVLPLCELVGDELWLPLGADEQRAQGMVFKKMVSFGKIRNLEHAETRHRTNYYRKI